MLTVVMVRSSCDNNAVGYVLPVFWMISSLNNGASGAESNTTLFRGLHQMVAPGEN